MNQPAPFDVTVRALQEYAISAPIPEMAGAVEALRLLHERPKEAQALFAEEAAPLPPTEKQTDLLRTLGYKGEVHSRNQASELIQSRLEARKRKQDKRTQRKAVAQ